MTNKLFYGDNLDVLREHIADESVDLIYLDPPFNSNASYSILFRSPEGQGADAQIEAFNDTWTWGPTASSALLDITQSGNHQLHTLMQAMRTAIGENAMMAYLAMMAVRLVELHRILKPTGSLYPTQKPRILLERIIEASSAPGALVLDPFCGCGTAIDAAQKLGRQWLGIDITHLAIGLVEKRLREGYGEAAEWETLGVPKDLASAQKLARDDPHQFQAWITLKLGGWPWMGGKKGGDKGVDGYFYYVGEGGQTETGVISVKAGANINPGMVRDLGRVMQRDGHKLGLFVCAALPTRGMEGEADSHGPIETEFGRFPALQLFTLAELFQDRRPKLPPLVSPNRRAPRVETRASHKKGAQGSLI